LNFDILKKHGRYEILQVTGSGIMAVQVKRTRKPQETTMSSYK